MKRYEIEIDVMLEIADETKFTKIRIQTYAKNSKNAIAKIMLSFMDTSFIKMATGIYNIESWEFLGIGKVEIIK